MAMTLGLYQGTTPMASMPVYIFDIDGTLADGKHREHLICNLPEGQKKDWDAYFALCGEDKPIPHMVQLCQFLAAHGKIIFVSGRTSDTFDITLNWLRDHVFPQVFITDLYMRSPGDRRDDNIIKIEILNELRSSGWQITMAFDDRSRVVKAWREAGIPCAQVREGDF
jgi:FMN phosphatase YigB (HAD superfamily)